MLLWLARSGPLVEMIAAIQLFNEMVSKFFWVLQLRCDAYIQDDGMHWMALVRCFDDGLYLSPDAFGIAKDAALSLLIAARFKRSVFFGSQK